MAENKSGEGLGKDLLYIPLGDMLTSIAKGIAESQMELDKVSMIAAEFMGGQRVERDPVTGRAIIGEDGNVKTIDTRVFFGHTIEGENEVAIPQKASMIELGFVPNFYHFVDTVINMKVAMKITRTGDNDYAIHTAPVDAHYASTYNYNLDFSASVQTKIVPIPPPNNMEERIRSMSEMWNRKDDLKIIDGIGPIIEYTLNELGINTWKKLSEVKNGNELQKMLQSENKRLILDPDDLDKWILQSTRASKGQWSYFEDDLTTLTGIGEKTVDKLKDAGITSFRDLVDASGDVVKDIIPPSANYSKIVEEAKKKLASRR